MVKKERVCVTGAGGYQALWLVKFLLSKGYMVHGTVRDPSDEKNVHLKKLENASENLRLFKADLLDYDGLCAAIAGCTGVFHVASPVPRGIMHNPEVEVIGPAVTGTSYVLKASSMAKVRKVVIVSSIGAVMVNPSWPKDQAMDESCWSDKEACKITGDWCCLSKTEAESLALEYAKRSELNVITVCPSLIIGPMLQSTLNASTGCETMENHVRMVVDVHDVAEALLLVYEKPEAEQRYICASYKVTMQDLVNKLKSMYPNYNYPKQITGVDEILKVSSEKLQKLGWKYRRLEDILVDSVLNYQEKGILDKA